MAGHPMKECRNRGKNVLGPAPSMLLHSDVLSRPKSNLNQVQ
ncbi:hypothetical protein LG3211_1213 [Lysobacter gummosus]|nr:hypothetical protein LG3211_1213 [Lysobacter gummosus]